MLGALELYYVSINATLSELPHSGSRLWRSAGSGPAHSPPDQPARERRALPAGGSGRLHQPLVQREGGGWLQRLSPSARPGPRASASAPASSVSCSAGGRCSRRRPPRSLTPPRGRFALGIGASSDGIIEGWNGMPFGKPLTKISETIDFLRTALAGERADGGLGLERAPEDEGAGDRGGAPRQDAAARGREGRTEPSPTSCPWRASPASPSTHGAPGGFELPLPGFCIPGERGGPVEPLARFMFSSYITVPVYEAFYRWLGYGDRGGEWWPPGTPRTARRRPRRVGLGSDRGDVHLRPAGADARAARRLRRGRPSRSR